MLLLKQAEQLWRHAWPLSPTNTQQYSGYSCAYCLKTASLRAAMRLYSIESRRRPVTCSTAALVLRDARLQHHPTVS